MKEEDNFVWEADGPSGAKVVKLGEDNSQDWKAEDYEWVSDNWEGEDEEDPTP